MEILSSVLTLSCAAFGAGILALPFAMKQFGIVFGISILSLLGTAIGVSMYYLMRMSETKSSKSYSALMMNFFPNSYFGVLSDVLVSFNAFGSCTSYMVILGGILPSCAQWLGLPSIFCNRSFVLFIVSLLIWPLSCSRNFRSIRIFSYVPIIALLLSTCLLMSRTPLISGIPPPAGASFVNFNLSFTSFAAFNVCLFAFMQHAVVVQVSRELSTRTPKRMALVASLAAALQITVYSLFATSGYLQFGSLTKDNLLLNYPINDAGIQFCRISVTLNMVMSMILNIIANNQGILSYLLPYIQKNNNELLVPLVAESEEIELSKKTDTRETLWRSILSGTTIIFCLLVGIFVHNVATVISLIGGICCSGMMCWMPSVLFLSGGTYISDFTKTQTAVGWSMVVLGLGGLFGIFFSFSFK
eukprot:GHVP01032729.1.p1 GENE.GHVP01032729.1~~GHVP01032729.1.p1  ORF type:complete len:416 (+),score=59.33 GHVP01032729.1:91-1338(+)